MFDEVNQAITAYQAKWQQFVAGRKNKEFFERLKPTAIGWKVADLSEYDRVLNTWREACDHVHSVPLNDRWIAILHLKDTTLQTGITLIELMQRRPGSSDALGLDHVDFLDMEETNTKAVLEEEAGVTWTEERNGIAIWTSVRFDNNEAKLRPNTALDISIAELESVNNQIRGDKFKVVDSSTGRNVSGVE